MRANFLQKFVKPRSDLDESLLFLPWSPDPGVSRFRCIVASEPALKHSKLGGESGADPNEEEFE